MHERFHLYNCGRNLGLTQLIVTVSEVVVTVKPLIIRVVAVIKIGE